MKCRSVACIWSASPPPHKVTAAATLSRPPTLYTGGSDGSIVWWNISATDANQEIKPVAMLCGHAAPIADLGICVPTVDSGDGKIDYLSNSLVNSNSSDYGALISVCTDGVLCIWSRGSGHCKRRRKMPPWVGTPSVIRTLPKNPRYVCVACCFNDVVHLFDHQSLDSIEGAEASMERNPQDRKTSRCTVVIVDAYTLTIVQTIFHGNLSIGPLRFMAIVSPVKDMEKQSVLLVDSYGKLQCVPILKEPNSDGENGTALQNNCYNLEMTDRVEGSSEGLQVVAFATSRQVVVHVYRAHCIFRLVASGTTIGEISFVSTQLCPEEGSTQSHVIGGMFLESDKTQESLDRFAEDFAVWNNRGFAVLYKITYSNNIFNFKLFSVIPAVAHPLDVRLSICFIQLSCYLLRIESICFHVEEPLLWKPHVTTWLLPLQEDINSDLHQECQMVGEGRFSVDWIASSTSIETEGLRHDAVMELTGRGTQFSQKNGVPCHNVDNISATDENYWFSQKGCLVSSSMVISESYSSMVISESYYTPYAVVYGFHSGEIEVVHFNIFCDGFDSCRSQPHEVSSNISKQYFLGHTGAVLCLAAHWMVGTAQGWGFSRVLVSGSMDCTIRIWDLDSGNLITVMHHHVAPVRQIFLPPPGTDRPWNDCFLSVGEDSCVTLVSLETLRVERMFPGHPYYPAKVVWDATRGYLACLCQSHSGTSDALNVLYIWDVKTGTCERVLRGTASHSMFDHFCKGINTNSPFGGVLNGNTSASSLLLPLFEDANLSQSHSHSKTLGKGTSSSDMFPSTTNKSEVNASQTQFSKGNSTKLFSSTLSILQSNKHPINCSCPFPGIAALSFDLALLMSPCQKHETFKAGGEKRQNTHVNKQGAETPKDTGDERDKNHMKEQGPEKPSPLHATTDGTILNGSDLHGTSADIAVDDEWVRSIEGCLLQFSLSFLHLWDVDIELDKLLMTDMKLKRPENFLLASGLLGDRGSLTLTFPSSRATLEVWKSSSEFSAMRSLTMVSLAQRTISLSHSCSAGSSALAAFYTRNFLEAIPDVKPPLLQLLVSFWQDESEHVRMASRSLFHCAASRAIPLPLCCQRANDHENLLSSSNGTGVNEQFSNTEKTFGNRLKSDSILEQGISQADESEIVAWLESFEVQDWISCVGGTSQDAMTSHIIVAAALAIWYPSLVKPSLAMLVVHPLMKLVMAMHDKYSSTAAELLAEGMESTWKACIASEIPHLIGDIFFQIECVSGAPANSSAQNPAVPLNIRKTLVGVLLPSLAMADTLGFLNVIESQIWSTASDSPVHTVSLMTLIRLIRGSPRNLAQYVDKVVYFILQTMDPTNSVMRKACLQSSLAALKEVVRVFPMVALNDTSTRLAVGDAIGDINNASIRVYDMQSMAKIKVLDASGPPGLPSLLGGASEVVVTTAISALSFSPEGEGLVAFSEHGLMIRWWSLGSAWWEKLSRNLVPVQCTKLIFVPPWEGFSPNSTRSSIMASVMGHDRQANTKENTGGLSDGDRLKLLIHNLDLSYRLEWVGERKVLLLSHGHKLGTFQL